MRLADVMITEVRSVSEDTPVAEAARVMVRGGFGSVVVLREGALVGIFTERDALRASAGDADPAGSRVGEWMTAEPVTAAPDLELDAATDRMLDGGFRHLPVVSGAEVVGIVSLRDVLASRIGRG